MGPTLVVAELFPEVLIGVEPPGAWRVAAVLMGPVGAQPVLLGREMIDLELVDSLLVGAGLEGRNDSELQDVDL